MLTSNELFPASIGGVLRSFDDSQGFVCSSAWAVTAARFSLVEGIAGAVTGLIRMRRSSSKTDQAFNVERPLAKGRQGRCRGKLAKTGSRKAGLGSSGNLF